MGFLKKNGVHPELGGRYSIRCQYAQIEGLVHDAMEKYTSDFIYFLREDDQLSEANIEHIKARFIDFRALSPERAE